MHRSEFWEFWIFTSATVRFLPGVALILKYFKIELYMLFFSQDMQLSKSISHRQM